MGANDGPTEGKAMTVADLIKNLEAMPGDAWVDVMFPTGADCFDVQLVELMTLRNGSQRVIVEITNNVPLRAV